MPPCPLPRAEQPWPCRPSLSFTGQMDDVLDYICPLHHSRDVHRHLPLLVSAPGTGAFQRAALWVGRGRKDLSLPLGRGVGPKLES